MTDTTAPPVAARGAARLLVDPKFGALFWGRLFAIVGVWTHGLVAAVVMFDATRSAVMVGLVGVVQFGPQLALSPLSGKWADRGQPIRQIMIGRILCVTGSGLSAVWLWLGASAGASGTVAAVLVGTTLVGVGFAVGGPAMMSIVPSLLRDGELSTAMALSNVPMPFGRIVGPVVGALVMSHSGPAAAFGVSAALHFVFFALLVLVRYPQSQPADSTIDGRVRAALHHVWRDRPLLLSLVAVTAVGFASDSSITLSPSMAQHLGGGTELVGAMSGAFGIGAAVGMLALALTKGRLAAARVSSLGVWALGAGSAVLIVAATPALALAGFVLAGSGFGIALTGLTTVVQERAPDHLRGRIMALWLVGFLGSRPLAAAVLGGTADAVDVRAAFAVAAVLTLATAVVCSTRNLSGP